MKDMITNGTGNSRYLKTSLASGTTWESALAMLREGTFPIDLNGLNNGGITQLGSAYSKANVLPDDVCALLGLNSTTAEPKDAFNVVGNPAELWVWEKFNYTPASYHDGETHTNETMLNLDTYDSEVTFYYSDSISVDELGTVSLINPSTLYLSYNNYSNASVLKGKYIKKIDSSQISFIPTTATFSRTTSNGRYLVVVSTLTYIDGVAAVFSHVEYVSSPNSSTYPENGQSGDHWYTRLGQIGWAARIETGSYIGTGTYGSDNPNSLTFSFKPKIIFITSPNGSSDSGQYFSNLMAIDGDFYPYMDGFVPDGYFKTYGGQMKMAGYMKINGNTITWYETTNDYGQANARGMTYYYFVIG